MPDDTARTKKANPKLFTVYPTGSDQYTNKM